MQNLGGKSRRRWSQHDPRVDEGGCGFGPEVFKDAKQPWTSDLTVLLGPSGPHRKSGGQASWVSGLSPDIPSLVTIATSDILSVLGALLVTDGFHSSTVGRCCLWAVPDSVRRRNTGRLASGTTFAHDRIAWQTDRQLQADRPLQRAIPCMGESSADPCSGWQNEKSDHPAFAVTLRRMSVWWQGVRT